MNKQSFFTIAGVAASLGILLFIYGFWQGIIQKNGDVYVNWSGIMILVALCSLIAGAIQSFRR